MIPSRAQEVIFWDMEDPHIQNSRIASRISLVQQDIGPNVLIVVMNTVLKRIRLHIKAMTPNIGAIAQLALIREQRLNIRLRSTIAQTAQRTGDTARFACIRLKMKATNLAFFTTTMRLITGMIV